MAEHSHQLNCRFFQQVDCREGPRSAVFIPSTPSDAGFQPGWKLNPESTLDPRNLDEDLEEVDVSCIGVRKECQSNTRCNRLLNDYRSYCRENKKLNHCLITEWRKCLTAIEELSQESSDLLQCTCPMKRSDIKEKCERIRWRLSNNTCLATIPYLAYSTKLPEPTYDELLAAAEVGVDNPTRHRTIDDDLSCIGAFHMCHVDDLCRSQLINVLSLCAWNASANDCNRKDCSEAIRNFYLLVRPERSQALHFCTCPIGLPSGNNCQTVRRAIVPACTTIEIPPPSCSDILMRCNDEPGCRERWVSYQQNCKYDETSGRCPVSGAVCLRSVIGVVGTVLTINCTCVMMTDTDESQLCQKSQAMLQPLSFCIDAAIANFRKSQANGSGQTPSDELWRLTSENDVQPKTGQEINSAGCKRHNGLKIPSFMTSPSVIRIYHNGTDCSDLCHCHLNSTVTCRTLPCSPNLSCKHKDILYVHGSSFTLTDRGQCRCIKSEVVCAKARFEMQPKVGLFIHMGYSIVEQYLIEGHSSVNFQLDRIKSKLSALLNEDSAEQFCRLSLHQSYDGNLIFEIALSKYSRKTRGLDSVENCMSSAKTLSHMINARHWTIITDPELSLLKVSQLERIRFHEHTPKEERKGGSSNASSLRMMLTTTTTTTMTTIGYHIQLAIVSCVLLGFQLSHFLTDI